MFTEPSKLSGQLLNRLTVFTILSLTVSSCAVYPNKFKCSDARGAPCTMLRDIDNKIDSGEIEGIYKSKNSKCSGVSCFDEKESQKEFLPEAPKHQARIHLKDVSDDFREETKDLEQISF
jgi:hypothetical protein